METTRLNASWWLVSMPKSKAAKCCGPFRMLDWQACIEGDIVWLRGGFQQGSIPEQVKKIPVINCFEMLNDGSYRLPGKLLTRGTLQNAWEPLSKFLQPSLPLAKLTKNPTGPLNFQLKLIQGREVKPASHLVVSLELFGKWVDTAIGIRLQALKWIILKGNLVVVRGQPLPSIPGQLFYNRDGLILPCGKEWAPSLEPTILRRWLGLKTGDQALWRNELNSLPGGWTLLPQPAWLPVKRRTVRLSLQAHKIND